MYSIFVNLKAAFDNVEREKLWRILEEKRNDKGLGRRLRKMYEGSTTVIRTKKGITVAFETRKKVKQECMLSPVLFNMYIADLGRFLQKKSGLKVSNVKIWSLACAWC